MSTAAGAPAHRARSRHSAFFDSEAATYDAAFDEPTVAGYCLRTRTEAVVTALGGGSGDVLDAGMGPGRLCERLDREGWSVSGTDSSAAMVALARARVPHASDRLLQGTLEELPFGDESFDVVVSSGVVEYVDDLGRALSEIARVLRPGGRAVITVPSSVAPYALWKRFVIYPSVRAVKRLRPGGRPPPVRRPLPSQRHFTKTLAGVGLAVESIRYTNYIVLPTPLETLLPRLSAKIADRFEHRQLRARALATQVVVTARLPAADAAGCSADPQPGRVGGHAAA